MMARLLAHGLDGRIAVAAPPVREALTDLA